MCLLSACAASIRADAQVTVIEADFLKVDLHRLRRRAVKMIGNLPFNAAAAIFRSLLPASRSDRADGRDVSARSGRADARRAGNLGILRALASTPRCTSKSMSISASPPEASIRGPKSTPRCCAFARARTLLFDRDEERRVLDTVRASFSAPRKKLRNSLAAGLSIASADAAAALARAQIDPTARAESLSPADFVRLARASGFSTCLNCPKSSRCAAS